MSWKLTEATEHDVTLTGDDAAINLRYTELDALIRTLRQSKEAILEIRREARKNGKCGYCGAGFERKPGPGRPRVHCSDDCRRQMSRTVYGPAWNARELRKK